MNKIKIILTKVLEIIKYIYDWHLLPILWMIAMWGCLSAAAFLFLGDLWRAMGLVSALTLFNVLRVRLSLVSGG